ncbi:MAG: hypothetical protein N3G20_02670, partial [Verrucomicrobiae bacterium]|nr:hypothetical protein [Verrucomicrobiae bacterium]
TEWFVIADERSRKLAKMAKAGEKNGSRSPSLPKMEGRLAFPAHGKDLLWFHEKLGIVDAMSWK